MNGMGMDDRCQLSPFVPRMRGAAGGSPTSQTSALQPQTPFDADRMFDSDAVGDALFHRTALALEKDVFPTTPPQPATGTFYG
jgi:hypothetical protein